MRKRTIYSLLALSLVLSFSFDYAFARSRTDRTPPEYNKEHSRTTLSAPEKRQAEREEKKGSRKAEHVIHHQKERLQNIYTRIETVIGLLATYNIDTTQLQKAHEQLAIQISELTTLQQSIKEPRMTREKFKHLLHEHRKETKQAVLAIRSELYAIRDGHR